MPPLQRDQLNHQHFALLQRKRVNEKIDSFDINFIKPSNLVVLRSTINPTTIPNGRTKDRFKTSSNIKIKNSKSGSNERHFHLSETPDLVASSSLLSSAFVASSAALVNAFYRNIVIFCTITYRLYLLKSCYQVKSRYRLPSWLSIMCKGSKNEKNPKAK
ncbi:uncharacterized protein LOC128264705 [Drosophila gunungcola]|uniref:uncharacterized protein LOC128264705 n=1 Tax=Drosophila gunungcola TaxID=103775 RepID=UPI0022E5CD66|nr:uncharacterized protein LOC128264705 [Drosophila gunungcola]